MKSVKLSSGKDIPIIALGTYTSNRGDCVKIYNAVKCALEIGIRHIDTAYFYKNEQIVGHAILDCIHEGVVKREDVFVTTKCWGNSVTRERVVEACKRSLFMLQTGYIDLYLLHTPFALKQGEELIPRDTNGAIITENIDIFTETWKGMEDCVRLGLVKSIGVSNFNSKQISKLLETCTIKPVINQVECHPLLSQKPLIEFCAKNDILVGAYSPLGGQNPNQRHVKTKLLDNPLLKGLSEKYSKTVTQILLKFHVQRNVVVVGKSFTPENIKSNFAIFDFEMTADEIKAIENLNENQRRVEFADYKSLPNYPFFEEF